MGARTYRNNVSFCSRNCIARRGAIKALSFGVRVFSLARCRKLLNVTLPKHLRFLAIRGSRKGSHAKHAWAHAFGHGLDGPALAGGVAALPLVDGGVGQIIYLATLA